MINTVISSVFSSVLSFVAAWFWFNRTKYDKEKEVITTLQRDVAVLQQSVAPLNAAFQAMLVKELTHFHTPEMDALLVLLGPPYRLDWKDEQRLVELLVERMNEVSGLLTESERDAAAILPAVIRRVKAELVIQKWSGHNRRILPVV